MSMATLSKDKIRRTLFVIQRFLGKDNFILNMNNFLYFLKEEKDYIRQMLNNKNFLLSNFMQFISTVFFLKIVGLTAFLFGYILAIIIICKFLLDETRMLGNRIGFVFGLLIYLFILDK